MGWNGSGVFNRLFSWVADKAAGLDISSSRMDSDTNDITANGFGNCLTRDGQGAPSTNLPMNNFRHTGVGNAVNRTDYASAGQAQDGTLGWSIAGGAADALTLTLTPVVTVLADGQEVWLRAAAANATTTPTLAVNGLTARVITKLGGQALAPGDIPGNLAECGFRYDIAHTRWEMINPGAPVRWAAAGGSADAITAANTPAIPALSDGLLCGVRAAAANATPTPTFAPDGLTAHTITKAGGSALIAGDIPGANAEILLRYNLANTRWELLNPAVPAVLPPLVPQGYLTPVSGTPIISSDATSATAIFYTPFMGGIALVHNGARVAPISFSEMQLTLSSSQAANNIYDVFLAFNGGTPVIGTGPSWAAGTGGSVTAGSCARGTGAGGTSLARLNGVWVNNVQISLIWNTGSGNTTITVPANQGIYLGSIFIDAVAGQVTCHRSYGQSRKWGVWNAYNRVPIFLKGGQTTGPWGYGSATVRPLNGNANNFLSIFTGLSEEVVAVNSRINVVMSGAGATHDYHAGIGWNASNAFSGFDGRATGTADVISSSIVGNYSVMPANIGINQAFFCELGDGTGAISTLNGGESDNVIVANWRG